MIIWKQSILPLGGFKAMFFFGILFLKGKAMVSYRLISHEEIHSRQFIEMLLASLVITLPLVAWVWWLFLISPFVFYLWYGIEWIIHLVRFKDAHTAYRRISFEREAYKHQDDINYLSNKKAFSFLKYI